MKKKLFLLSLLCVMFCKAQTARKYSNEFLNLGTTAKGFAMANALTATTNDVSAGYYNPAGLMQVQDRAIALTHGSYFSNIASYDYIGYAMPIDKQSAWGASMIRFGVDDILNTTQLIDSQGNIDYNRISRFSAADYAFTFSYARNLKVQGFSYGVNAKVIHRIIGDFATAWGFGFDAGIQFKKNHWHFGVMLQDITTTFNTWQIQEDLFKDLQTGTAAQELPETTEITLPKAKFGVAKTFVFKQDYTLTTALDLHTRFSQTNAIINSKRISIAPALGLDFNYKKMAFLRAGVGNIQKTTGIDGEKTTSFQPNIGLGFRYKGIAIDYALTDIGDQSIALYSNIFSLTIDWEFFRSL